MDMDNLSGEWTGKILGTNNADIYAEIAENEGILAGTVRINDPLYGIAVYTFNGNRDGLSLNFEMDPTPNNLQQKRTHTVVVDGRPVTVETEGVNLGHVTVNGRLIESGRVEGKWVSSLGTGGTFWIVSATRNVEIASKYNGTQMENIAFIMMRVSSEDPALQDSLNAIKRATSQHGIEGVRVDEIEHSKKITDVILQKIRNSRFLICDITNERPNVYYEIGYAHGIEKEVILVAKEGTNLHFDIKDYNVIFYKSYSELESRVARRIGEAIGNQQDAPDVVKKQHD
jgi:hypothetical protein